MLKRIAVNNYGVGWVFGVAFIALLVMPVIYFPLSYTWDQVSEMILGEYVFTGAYANSLMVVQVIISYLTAFGLLFVINWAIVQAKARRYSN